MTEKRDKLGRRIPQFDRSEAGKRSAKTRKENHGNDTHARAGSLGGRARTRGYFGKLKDEGKIDELKTISSIGAKEANRVKKAKRAESEQPITDGAGLPTAGFGPGK